MVSPVSSGSSTPPSAANLPSTQLTTLSSRVEAVAEQAFVNHSQSHSAKKILATVRT